MTTDLQSQTPSTEQILHTQLRQITGNFEDLREQYHNAQKLIAYQDNELKQLRVTLASVQRENNLLRADNDTKSGALSRVEADLDLKMAVIKQQSDEIKALKKKKNK